MDSAPAIEQTAKAAAMESTDAVPLISHQPASEVLPSNVIDMDAEAAAAAALADPIAALPSEPGDPNRPSDEAILQQQNEIRAEEAKKIPYVADIEPIEALKAEYEAGSQVFIHKIDKLAQDYSSIRRTRGDGNCFFRAFAFGYLESLVNSLDLQERSRLADVVRKYKEKLVQQGFEEMVFEDAQQLLIDQIEAIGRPGHAMTVDGLVGNFRDDTISNMVIMFLRFVTSCEVQQREDHFFPFIMGMYDDCPPTVQQFCRRFIEPMAEESDHVHIVALSDALQVPLRVVYLDRSGMLGGGSDLDVTTHDFIPDSCPPGTQPRVSLLYRPGHYDLLYPRQQ